MNHRILKMWRYAGVAVFGLGSHGNLAAAENDTGVNACDVARHYIGFVNAGRYSEIGDLFAEDALYLPPTGETINGREGIQVFYERFLGDLRPTFRIGHAAEQGADCAIELEAADRGKVGTYTLTAVDYFTVNSQGLISRMAVYLRPAAFAAMQKSRPATE